MRFGIRATVLERLPRFWRCSRRSMANGQKRVLSGSLIRVELTIYDVARAQSGRVRDQATLELPLVANQSRDRVLNLSRRLARSRPGSTPRCRRRGGRRTGRWDHTSS
jgi:hypothetical protein